MSPNTTTTTKAANSTTIGTGGTGGGGGGAIIPNVPGVPDKIELVPHFPSGWGLLSNALAGLTKSFTSGVGKLIDQFHRNLITLPAAGDPMAPATWVSFHDPYWAGVATVYGMLSAFVLPLVWGIGWFNVGYTRGVSRKVRLKKVMWALVLIIAGWEFLQFWFHFWNEAALAFVPSGSQFFSTPGNTAKLGVGVILGVILLLYNAVVILAGLLIHLCFVILTYLFVALWPLSVGLYMSDMFVLETIGNGSIMATLLLSPLQFGKAVILRFIMELPLDPQHPGTAMTFLFVAIGVTIAFVALPYYGLKRLIPRSVVATGGRIGRKAGESERMRNLRDRVPSREELRSKVVSVATEGTSRLSDRGSDAGSSLQARTRQTTLDSERWSHKFRDSPRTKTNVRTRRGTELRQARSRRSDRHPSRLANKDSGQSNSDD